MELETAVGLIALSWLVGSVLLMARPIRSGRDIAEKLATRDPVTYEALDRPRGGYFESVRRMRFAGFVGRREFENLSDGALAAEFEAYRKSEARLVLSILAGGVVVALLACTTRDAA